MLADRLPVCMLFIRLSIDRHYSLSELEEHSLEQLSFIRYCLFIIRLLQGIDDRLDALAVNLDGVQEVEDLVKGAVRENEHVLRQSFDQAHQTTLGVEPSVCAEFLLEGFEGLDDTRHTEVVIALGTVEGTNDQVDNAKVVDLLGGLFHCDALFFFLDALHQLFGVGILTGHDVTDAQVGEHDSSDGEEVVHLTSDEGLVVSDGVPVFVVLHEEHVRHIQLPCLVLGAELSALAEDLLHLGVVSFIPVDLRLHHQNGDVLVESIVVLGQSVVDGFGVSGDSGVLNGLRLLSKRVDVLVSEVLELSVRLVLRGLVQNEVLKEFKIFLRQALVCQVRIFGQDVSSEVVMLVLAVQKDQVRECL